MNAKNSQIDVYLKDPERITHKTRELIEIIKNTVSPNLSGECLDICCGSGSLIKNLANIYQKINFTGFDISQTLINKANELYKNNTSNFIVGDVNSINFDKKFDIICASGALSIFQEFEYPLKKWLSWLNEDGHMFICGRFNSKNVDTKILFRDSTKINSNWEGGLSSYSVETVSDYIKKLGYKCNFKKFNLPINIKEDINNPLRTFTKELKNGEKLIMDGANVIAEYYFLTIGKNLEN